MKTSNGLFSESEENENLKGTFLIVATCLKKIRNNTFLVKHMITPKKKTIFSRKYENPVSDFFIFTKITHIFTMQNENPHLDFFFILNFMKNLIWTFFVVGTDFFQSPKVFHTFWVFWEVKGPLNFVILTHFQSNILKQP